MKSVLPVLQSVREKNPVRSAQGLKIILTKLKQQVNETNLSTSLKNGFGRDAANDATSFQVAWMVMECQFDEENNGELAQMKAQLNDLRASMENNNKEIISLQNSLAKMTKQLTHQSRTCFLLMTLLEHNPIDEEWKEVEKKIQKTLDLWSGVGGCCCCWQSEGVSLRLIEWVIVGGWANGWIATKIFISYLFLEKQKKNMKSKKKFLQQKLISRLQNGDYP